MNYIAIFLTTAIVFLSCKENQKLHEDLYQLNTPQDTNFKKEIPANCYTYVADKYKEEQLGLEYIESGYENFQLRLWVDYALYKGRELYIIRNKNGKWSAEVYKMMTERSLEIEDSIVSKQIKSLVPKSGWDYLLTNLVNLKVTTLPDMENIPGFTGTVDDGVDFNIEIASKYQYRYYNYHSPEYFQDKYWQAKNMVQIVKLIRTELNPD